MPSLRSLGRRVIDRLRGRALSIWYHPDYRLTLPGLKSGFGIEPRRADFVAWYLVGEGLVQESAIRRPARVLYEDLARIHEAELLSELGQVDALARVFGAAPGELSAEQVLLTTRLACGATVEAALAVARDGGAALNLLGGFHHASPTRAAGFCLVNDIAVAVARLRAEGYSQRIAVIDLDAHPPDGTAACLGQDPEVWIGSLSGVDWGPLPPADETALPDSCGDAAYLEALDALLERMPAPGLAFVIAGGDVLAGDRMGGLALSLVGARERDRRVAEALDGVPSVWLPGGGYSPRAWRVLAGTALVLAGCEDREIPEDYNPLDQRFSAVARQLEPGRLGDSDLFTAEDLEEALGMPRSRIRALGFYTADGVEYALYRYGILSHLERLGYRDIEVRLDQLTDGDRVRVISPVDGREEVLVELVLDRKVIEGEQLLFIHWLNLRHPRAAFGPRRPQLPGQDVPGLGMVTEVITMLRQVVIRLNLAGMCYQPAWLHTAYVARRQFQFLDPGRQGRFLALLRDLGHIPLVVLTRALSDGRVTLNGEPYRWEPGIMVRWEISHSGRGAEAVAAERERCRFALIA